MPFSAHSRKLNHRSGGGFESAAGEHLHVMARRGQAHSFCADDPTDCQLTKKLKKEVGLSFMPFHAKTSKHFDLAQKTGANNVGYSKVSAGRGSTGLDITAHLLPTWHDGPRFCDKLPSGRIRRGAKLKAELNF